MFTTLLLGSARGTPWTYLHVHVFWIKCSACIYVYYVECGATGYISGYRNKMDEISITKVAYVIYVASCFWRRVKPRGHCIRYRDIYSRFPLLCIDISAKLARTRDFEWKKEEYAVPKRRCPLVHGYYFIVTINFRSDDLNFC